MSQQYSEVRDGMRIDWDVPIEMDDGVVLRADVFRPDDDGEYPPIMSHGPYGKWLHFDQLYEDQWVQMLEEHPDVGSGTTTNYVSWEVMDPEKWIPHDYAVVKVDSRGAGRSPGHVDVWSHREAQDFKRCIEWAGNQPWSNGKVGLNGISYYAMNQWQVAALKPDHLAAMCVWEGVSDFYREIGHHGGIFCTFAGGWYQNQVVSVQHGLGPNGYRSPMTGDWVSGPTTLRPEELGNRRQNIVEDYLSNKLASDDYWASRNPDLSDVDVPLLSAANWGHSLHLRGNVEGYLGASSDQKWLEIHGGTHWTKFYTRYGRELQRQFFDHFLHGEDNGWDDRPDVQLHVRHPGEQFEERFEDDWPIPRTDWTRYYLEPDEGTMSTEEPAGEGSVTYNAFGDGVTFLTDPLDEAMEVTGPVASKLFVSSDTEDADLFLILRLFKPDMEEVVFQGAVDPHRPLTFGWLRASHRKLDLERSTEWRPYHTHDEVQPLTPGEVYELDVEIWPTSIVAPPGSRLGLTVRGKDYQYPGGTQEGLENVAGGFTGVGPFRHDDPADRPPEVYGGDVTIHVGPDRPSHVLLPVIPE
jgi:predicted acyl esterase